MDKWVITCPMKCVMKLLVHSQTAAPLKFGNGQVIYWFMMGLKLIHASKKGPRCPTHIHIPQSIGLYSGHRSHRPPRNPYPIIDLDMCWCIMFEISRFPWPIPQRERSVPTASTLAGLSPCNACKHVLPYTMSPMVTSSNGNIFLRYWPLWGEFTGDRWIPLTKASDAELWCLLWSAPE